MPPPCHEEAVLPIVGGGRLQSGGSTAPAAPRHRNLDTFAKAQARPEHSRVRIGWLLWSAVAMPPLCHEEAVLPITDGAGYMLTLES
jgi:hypothetical protein